jgi:hypothetical protein
MASNQERDDSIEELTQKAVELLAQVERLGDGTGASLVKLTQETRRTRHIVLAMIASFVLDIMLTVFLTLGFVSLHDTDKQVNKVTDRLDNAQTVQRQKALCPLYQIFVEADTPQNRAAAPDKSRYDKNFTIIRQGYDALKCSEFKGGPPTLGTNGGR